MEAARKVYHAELRAARRAKARAQNEPPRLTLGEEVFNAVSHGAGGLLAVAATVLPVSYTHLDVYKRQLLITLFDGWERAARLLGRFPLSGNGLLSFSQSGR